MLYKLLPVRYKDGVDMQESHRVTISHFREHHGYVLTIHDCQYDDIGLYKCEAHSWAGRSSSSAKLTVLGKVYMKVKLYVMFKKQQQLSQLDSSME